MLKEKMSYEEAYNQVQRREAENRMRGPVEEAGNCPCCTYEYNRREGRERMRAPKCNHLICQECIDAQFPFVPAPCYVKSCKEIMTASDFVSHSIPINQTWWQIYNRRVPSPPPLPTASPEQGSREGTADSLGLFVTGNTPGRDLGDDETEVKVEIKRESS